MKKRKSRKKRHSLKPRRNYYVPGFSTNPRKKRRRRRRARALHNPRRLRSRSVFRRRFKRNPPEAAAFSIAGFKVPALAAIGGTVGGLIVPAILMERLIIPNLPASISGNPAGRWAIRMVSVFATALVADKAVSAVFGKTTGKTVSTAAKVGGFAYLAIEGLKEFAPGLIPGLGMQPMLGFYPAVVEPSLLSSGMGAYRDYPSTALVDIPERLDPGNRY